jgi:transposase
MLQANQNQALLPSEKPRPSPSKPPLRRYAAFTPKAGERLPLGMILIGQIQSASVQDRDGALPVLAEARRLFTFIKKIFADGGYQGEATATAVALIGHWELEIVKRSDTAKGFVVLPKRWIVERTFAWLGRCRRLSKHVENLTRSALAFLRLAMIRLMMRRIARLQLQQ